MPVRLTAKFEAKSKNLLTLTSYTRKLVETETQARKAAATTATTATRNAFHTLRPVAPPRPGRHNTAGGFRNALQWTADSSADGQVSFDIAEADRIAPYWIILEIGTDARAMLRRGGQNLPQGRPQKGASYVRTVKSQKGRLIPISLGFADSAGGKYTPPGPQRNQQLFLRRMLQNNTTRGALRGSISRPRGVDQLVIRNEIKPQNFVKKGGTEGFHQYRTSVLAAARRTFAGRGYRP